MANTFGTHFKITSFGESHGSALGVVIDGCPAQVPFDHALLTRQLERRRPGLREFTSARGEVDEVEILSGVYNEKTLGTPIAMLVRNHDARPGDYKNIDTNPRRGHADDVWIEKFGISDPRGGGRASGRETVARVMAGAVAQMFLRQTYTSLEVKTLLTQVGPLPCACDPLAPSSDVITLLENAQKNGESFGATLQVTVNNAPAKLGQPVFHKLKADLAHAVFGIGAVHGLEFGASACAATSAGSVFHGDNTPSSVYGGIRGGISTGEPILFQVNFKPTSSILDVAKKGRHDPCIAIRASVVVENMVWLVLADHVLWQRLDRA